MLRRTVLGLMAASVMLAAPLAAEAAPRGKVLVLMSNAEALPLQGGARVETGFYLNEFGVPASKLQEAGYEIVVATPDGRRPKLDPKSDVAQYFGGSDGERLRIKAFVEGLPTFRDPLTLKEARQGGLDQYAGVFIPGGHAPMVDLADSPDAGAILRHFHERGKPTAAICHGPMALLAAQRDPAAFEAALVKGEATTADGWVYAGYRMTVFSRNEEVQVEKSSFPAPVLYYPTDALLTAGAAVSVGAPWTNHVVVDRELITGQNPFSDDAFTRAFLDALNRTLVTR